VSQLLLRVEVLGLVNEKGRFLFVQVACSLSLGDLPCIIDVLVLLLYEFSQVAVFALAPRLKSAGETGGHLLLLQDFLFIRRRD
jgi:hypothetical protein